MGALVWEGLNAGWRESTECLRWKVRGSAGRGWYQREASREEWGSIMSPTDLALKLSPDLFTSSWLLYLTLCIFKFGIILPPNKQGCSRDRWQSNSSSNCYFAILFAAKFGSGVQSSETWLWPALGRFWCPLFFLFSIPHLSHLLLPLERNLHELFLLR